MAQAQGLIHLITLVRCAAVGTVDLAVNGDPLV